MKTFKYNTGSGKSEISIGKKIRIPELPASRGIYVFDTNMEKYLSDINRENSVILPSGEEFKNLESITRILDKAQELNLGRDSLFVGIGGGVITDMTAFAASIYMRGAKLCLLPTSLLAMVDAAVGGKTGIDYGGYKNSAGTFYPADKVLICTDFLKTLPAKEFYCGLGEVLKTAMLYDKKLLSLMEDKADIIKGFSERTGTTPETSCLEEENEILLFLVSHCVMAKCNIVEKDLKESGLRMELNLGHTFAHALESFAGLGELSHGEAVAWGLGRALELGVNLGITDKNYRNKIFSILKTYNWTESPMHPAAKKSGETGGISDADIPEKLLEAMYHDKKKRKGEIRFVLQKKACSTVIRKVEDREVLKVLSDQKN